MILFAGALLGCFAVGFGAYAEHGLKASIQPETFSMIETALRYNLIHAAVIVAIGLAQFGKTDFARSNWLRIAGLGFIAGVVVFCFSIYLSVLLKMPNLTGFAPFGGMTLIASWALLGMAGLFCRSRQG